jgi:arylformamidase
MTEIYDISVTIGNGFPVWPGDPKISLERISKIEEGASANVSLLTMSVHTGTHLDAPYHFLADGKTVETLALETLIGPVQVVQIPDAVRIITGKDIKNAGIRSGIERVLFKTSNNHFWEDAVADFQTDFVALDKDGARTLVSLGIRLVGIDYMSIAPFDDGVPTHEVLLKNGVIILENCNLSAVKPGMYTLYALPLKLGGSDGAPVRAVLIK